MLYSLLIYQLSEKWVGTFISKGKQWRYFWWRGWGWGGAGNEECHYECLDFYSLVVFQFTAVIIFEGQIVPFFGLGKLVPASLIVPYFLMQKMPWEHFVCFLLWIWTQPFLQRPFSLWVCVCVCVVFGNKELFTRWPHCSWVLLGSFTGHRWREQFCLIVKSYWYSS